MPARASEGAAGYDLCACLDDPLVLAPLARALVPTGVRLALPPEMEAQVRPRSGLALNKGVTVLNAPGTIDPDYRGEIGVILVNLGAEQVIISHGERIAQLVFHPLTTVEFTVVESLDGTARGWRGFGSTGS